MPRKASADKGLRNPLRRPRTESDDDYDPRTESDDDNDPRTESDDDYDDSSPPRQRRAKRGEGVREGNTFMCFDVFFEDVPIIIGEEGEILRLPYPPEKLSNLNHPVDDDVPLGTYMMIGQYETKKGDESSAHWHLIIHFTRQVTPTHVRDFYLAKGAKPRVVPRSIRAAGGRVTPEMLNVHGKLDHPRRPGHASWIGIVSRSYASLEELRARRRAELEG